MSNLIQTPRVLSFDLPSTFIAALWAQVALLLRQENRHFSYKRDEDTHCAQHASMPNVPIRNGLRKRLRIIAGIIARPQMSSNASTVAVL
jgi:hypothetical protein